MYEGELDRIIGILLQQGRLQGPAGKNRVQHSRSSPSGALCSQLAAHQRAAQQSAAPPPAIALVVNEFGGVEGLATLGRSAGRDRREIRDEYDREERGQWSTSRTAPWSFKAPLC